jgi:hypothetical protein
VRTVSIATLFAAVSFAQPPAPESVPARTRGVPGALKRLAADLRTNDFSATKLEGFLEQYELAVLP